MLQKKPSSSSNSSSKPNKKNDVQPTTQDKYKTDPVPSGKPKPVEPEEQETKDTNLYCTFTITCSTILNNIDDLDPEKIELVNNLYEFDCGSLSGWMYKVNEWFPNYGCSRYVLKNGDDVVWCYTCNLGYDVGGGYATGE